MLEILPNYNGWNILLESNDTTYQNVQSSNSGACQIGNDQVDHCQMNRFKAGLWQSDLGMVYAYFDVCSPHVVKTLTYAVFKIDQF